MAKPIAQRMHKDPQTGVIFRVKHIDPTGAFLFFEADGLSKLDPKLMWCFSAENKRPIKPMLFYEDDASFVENHFNNHE